MRWLFTDRTNGRIVIGQRPNLALWIVLASLAVGTIAERGSARTAVDVVGVVSLFLWAIDEVLCGANPWRRILGVVVLLWLCVRGIVAFVHQT